MSECVDYYRAAREIRKALRAHWGEPCPECVRRLPRAQPAILLPGERCRIHRYTDIRDPLTEAEENEALAAHAPEFVRSA
jgi:hypothetical protein